QVCTTLPARGEACTAQPGCAGIGDTCNATALTCVAVRLGGDAGTTRAHCSPVYDCGGDGKCALRPTVGQACMVNSTTGATCIDGSFCDAATNVCTARQADRAEGTSGSECAGHTCDVTRQTCVTPPVCI